MHAANVRCALYWCALLFCLFPLKSQAMAQSSSSEVCSDELQKAVRTDTSGPLSIYQLEDETILLEIEASDLEKDFIFSNYIDKGVAPYVGQYAAPKLVTFRLNDKKIDIIHKDSVGYFNDDEAISRTRQLTTSDAILASLTLFECQSDDVYLAQINQRALTKLSNGFLQNFRTRASQISSKMQGWQSFSDNINFMSEHRLSNSNRRHGLSIGANFSIRIRHIFFERPISGFTPRRHDLRVGYFTVARKNLGDFDQTAEEIYINKWRLDKKDPDAALSEPVKPIVFWIENTTPYKLRPYIKKGILAWNEAFRKAGFLNAIEVYEQPEDADWDAGEISKNVIRWQSAHHNRGNLGFAPAMHDPVTGEIFGSDVVLNYAGIGGYLDDWVRLAGDDAPLQPTLKDISVVRRDIQYENTPIKDKVSNLAPAKPTPPTSNLESLYLLASLVEENQKLKKQPSAAAIKKIQSPAARAETSRRAQSIAAKTSDQTSSAHPDQSLGFAERMIKEVVIQLAMHEVGHSLGLMHNFRGSRWRSMDEIFDREKTNGVISASVMDYMPINFSPIGAAQGDFANTRLGPYDIWAIEFGYRPDLSESQRNALLQQAVKPENAFSVGALTGDPHTLLRDLTDTPVKYAKSRIKFAVDASTLAPGNAAFSNQQHYINLVSELTGEIFNATLAIVSQITPFTSSITHFETSSSSPFKTVGIHSKAVQQDAIKALEETVFAADALQLSEEFVRRLGDNFSPSLALKMQTREMIMFWLMHPRTLFAMHHAEEYGADYRPTELLFDLKQAVFGADLKPLSAPVKNRRDQQLLFAHRLAYLIQDETTDYDSSNLEESLASAAARPVRDDLLRDLSIPVPWASRDVRAHRKELRAILQ